MKKKLILIFMILLISLISVSAAPDFRIKSISFPDNDPVFGGPSVVQGKNLRIVVEIQNVGTEGTMFVESGMYDRSVVYDWYGGNLPFSTVFDRDISNVENCIAGETNVDTKEVTLGGGETKLIAGAESFNVKALLSNPDKNYVVHVAAFNECWNANNAGDPNRVTDSKIKSINLKSPTFGDLTSETCTDGNRNQDETDVDCGGDACGVCDKFQLCQSDIDCPSGLVCDDETFGGPERCEEPLVQDTTDTNSPTTNTDSSNDNNNQGSFGDQSLNIGSLGGIIIGFGLFILFVVFAGAIYARFKK